MKWLKSYWLPLSVLALLVMVDVNFPASHALFPLALVMWFEYAAFSLVCFAGLYSCTLTGSDRLRVRQLLSRVLGLMDKLSPGISVSLLPLSCCLPDGSSRGWCVFLQ